MMKKRSSKKLKIFLNCLPLGSLAVNQGNLKFTYEKSWIERADCFPVSRSLPITESEFDGPEVFAFFDNLLPESISVRQRLAARMRAASEHVFDLLEVVGRDCVGALQFVKEDDEAPILVQPKGIPISDQEISNKLKNLKSSPLAASNEEDIHLSIAGVQEKTAFLWHQSSWQIPRGATPTTHIFKPQMGELKPGLSFSNSVENEWLCAQIVNKFGLKTAKCQMKEFGDVKTLVVERFDRAWIENGSLIRIPQEDMCQALAVPTFTKYESDGGPGISQIMQVLYESNQKGQDRRNFLKTQVVFYLLAAIDGHAKNFSIIWTPSGFQLTPLYDVLSAQPMVDKGKFQMPKLRMAMALGNNRHYKIREICRRYFLETAKLCKFEVKDMENIIDETTDSVPQVIDQVSSLLDKKFPAEVADSIFTGMNKRRRI